MISKKRVVLAKTLIATCAILSSYTIQAMNSIRLLGIGNYFELLRTKPSERPTVRITKAGNQLRNIFINPQTYRGQLQVIDLLLPLEIEVKFSTYNAGQPYTLIIERITDVNSMLACPGVSMGTVKASIKGSTIHQQKVCVPLSSSTLLTSVSPIYSGDFNNVVLFIGPLGVHDTYDPQDVRSLPFTFGLMGWTSLVAPWNNRTINQTFDQREMVRFSRPLEVLQGFAALGGGFIPRAYHMSLGHIYNDSPYIIIMSRESSNRTLASFNISQIVPPYSVMPYALVWAPKIKDADELAIPGHDGIRIAALEKHETAPAPTAIRHSDIKELGPLNNAGIPVGMAELEKLIAESLQEPVTKSAESLLGITLWNEDMKSEYAEFDAADHYYVISTMQTDASSYVQKFSVKENYRLPEDVSSDELLSKERIVGSIAYDKNGNPGYCNIVIKGNPGQPGQDEQAGTFEVRAYPAAIRPPKRR